MASFELKTPISKETISKLKVGDVVYLNGVIYTARDEAHLEIIKYHKKGKELPFNLENGVIYHAGPIMKKENDKWVCVAIGPTTSARMNNTEEEVIKVTNLSAIVGKGGMKKELLKTFKEHKVVYLAAPGGCAALLANCIKEVKNVYFLELGMPEAVWELEVENFGPLIVAMDAHGNSIYEEVNEKVFENLKMMVQSQKI
ncbi:FumA C-terminus/TtdB family hydratase beta subunit [Methanotorris igneus]|uniref:Hydro-lyase, Fe-S type, tartrate/fumarate subfamily, beta subunit n=1 Tax=Methanotorris igneus (strain DSM 5666 / JCM 11834 / Kol 5) TaxID=880724 RepID=F6BE85_METIK|nr:FumA C-terminus/TtdB family hydratase beta subunit [Methanotorris igneus]AEF96762.1 hydro-lyase, Fe-S type, tartrate/fumarate subfamily, beta subunit [Methanotorris igneus Kol 5]